MLLRAAVTFAVLATFAAGPALANPNCPQSCFIGGHATPICTTDSVAAQEYRSGTNQIGTGIYDLTQGIIEAAGTNCLQCGTDIAVQTNDDFQLGGTEPGVPVTFRAELHARLLFYFYEVTFEPFTESLLIRDAFGNESSVMRIEPCPPTPTNFERDTTLALTIVATPGSPCRIHCEASSSGHSHMTGVAYGTLSFAELPPGAFITSCQGYHQDGPIATRRSTWGDLKATYR